MTTTSPNNPSATEMRRMRTEFNFRRKHGDDGLAELMEQVKNYERTEVIAERFGVTPARVSQILFVLLGKPYNVHLAEHGIKRKKVTPQQKGKQV